MKINNIIERIITLNHAWKVARDDFGPNHSITLALRQQKSSWQATLIRDFSTQVYLRRDIEGSSENEPLFSVRLVNPISINGVVRHDAEHLPERIAQHLFHPEELQAILQ